jgi:SAM-dependent methyltransferase
MILEIIIPTRKPLRELTPLLSSISNQTALPAKIVIIHSDPENKDHEYIKEQHPKLGESLQFFFSSSYLTHKLNMGIRQAGSDVILFLHDHVLLHDDYCSRLLEVFENDKEKKVGGVTGKIANQNIIPNRTDRIFRKAFNLPHPGMGEIIPSGLGNLIRSDVDTLLSVGWLPGSNMAYRKEVLADFLFDENLFGSFINGDLDFSFRVSKKWNLLYVPDARLEVNPDNERLTSTKADYQLSVCSHVYLFRKNMTRNASAKAAVNVSLLGMLLESIFIKRKAAAVLGTISGLTDVALFKNYKLPDYLERLDFKRPSKKQIAELTFKYSFIAENCIGKEVLDCASGEGLGVNILRHKAKFVTGVDIDNDTILRAAKNITAPNVHFVTGSALALPFPDNHFEMVSSVETFEHLTIDDQEQLLSEFKRVLKTDGILFLTTPNKDRSSPGKIAASNYFHIGELNYQELQRIFRISFPDAEFAGVFNFFREGSLESIMEKYADPYREPQSVAVHLSFRKKILLLLPDNLRNVLSGFLTKKSIFPQLNEFSIDKQHAGFASDVICIGRKH